MDTAEQLKNDKDFHTLRRRLAKRRNDDDEEELDVDADLGSKRLGEYDDTHNTKRKQMEAAKNGHLRPTFEPDARIEDVF